MHNGITHRDFKVGDHVFLKVKAKRISLKLGNYSKLVVRYCVPLEILERIGHVAYILTLPASMCIHNVFYVSLLKNYEPDVNHVIDWNVIQVEQEGEFRNRCAYWMEKSSCSIIEQLGW
jgi:hypothetical protein